MGQTSRFFAALVKQTDSTFGLRPNDFPLGIRQAALLVQRLPQNYSL